MDPDVHSPSPSTRRRTLKPVCEPLLLAAQPPQTSLLLLQPVYSLPRLLRPCCWIRWSPTNPLRHSLRRRIHAQSYAEPSLCRDHTMSPSNRKRAKYCPYVELFDRVGLSPRRQQRYTSSMTDAAAAWSPGGSVHPQPISTRSRNSTFSLPGGPLLLRGR